MAALPTLLLLLSSAATTVGVIFGPSTSKDMDSTLETLNISAVRPLDPTPAETNINVLHSSAATNVCVIFEPSIPRLTNVCVIFEPSIPRLSPPIHVGSTLQPLISDGSGVITAYADDPTLDLAIADRGIRTMCICSDLEHLQPANPATIRALAHTNTNIALLNNLIRSLSTHRSAIHNLLLALANVGTLTILVFPTFLSASSSADFQEPLGPLIVRPLLQFLDELKPINLYNSHSRVRIGFVQHLFNFFDYVINGARDRNLFHMMVDAVRALLTVSGQENVSMIETETGWRVCESYNNGALILRNHQRLICTAPSLSTCSADALPIHLWEEILYALPQEDQIHCNAVCREWRMILKPNIVGHKDFERKKILSRKLYMALVYVSSDLCSFLNNKDKWKWLVPQYKSLAMEFLKLTNSNGSYWTAERLLPYFTNSFIPPQRPLLIEGCQQEWESSNNLRSKAIARKVAEEIEREVAEELAREVAEESNNKKKKNVKDSKGKKRGPQHYSNL